MNAEDARNISNKSNKIIAGTIGRLNNDIVTQADRGETYLTIDHAKYNNMSTNYWKNIITYYKSEGYTVKPFGTVITISW